MERRKRRQEEGMNYWQSYSDMMAALLLMFVLIMSQTLLQSLNDYKEKLEVQQQQIELQEQAAQRFKEQETKLAEQQKQLDALIGIRSKLIEQLSIEFKNSNLKVLVDAQTGAITFDSSVLFDHGQYALKDSGKQFLSEFLPIYFHVMLGEEFLPYISEIIIEGHTDTTGTYMYNLELSQKRAFEVAAYCLDPSQYIVRDVQQEYLKKIITANGRSMSNPKLKEDGTVDMGASRRVEFKFRMKDDEMISQMQNILEE